MTLRQPAQVLACIAWPKYGQVGALPLPTKRSGTLIYPDFDTDQVGNKKLIGLKVIGKPERGQNTFSTNLNTTATRELSPRNNTETIQHRQTKCWCG